MTHFTCIQCISSSGQSAYTKPEAEAGQFTSFLQDHATYSVKAELCTSVLQ